MGKLSPPKRVSVWASFKENVKSCFEIRPISDLVFARFEHESQTQEKNDRHYRLIGHEIESRRVLKARPFALRGCNFLIILAPFVDLPVFIDSGACP